MVETVYFTIKTVFMSKQKLITPETQVYDRWQIFPKYEVHFVTAVRMKFGSIIHFCNIYFSFNFPFPV